MDITLHIACKSDPLWGGIALLFLGLRRMAFLFLFANSLAYGLLLQLPKGRWLARERTAETVILGTGLVLAHLRFIIPSPAWSRVAAAFAVAGSAMYFRSLYNRLWRKL
jgi:hypothetical protein